MNGAAASPLAAPNVNFTGGLPPGASSAAALAASAAAAVSPPGAAAEVPAAELAPNVHPGVELELPKMGALLVLVVDPNLKPLPPNAGVDEPNAKGSGLGDDEAVGVAPKRRDGVLAASSPPACRIVVHVNLDCLCWGLLAIQTERGSLCCGA